MQIIQLIPGDDGRTHVKDLTPEDLARIAHRFVGPVTIPTPNSPGNRPGGFFADWHPLPTSGSLLVMCTGISEYECAEGWRRLMPGDVILMEDPTGQGHRFHVRGLESRIALRSNVLPEESE
jgi:hypothetical protein